MDKLIINFEKSNPASNKYMRVRICTEHYNSVTKAAKDCGMSFKDMTDILMGFALGRLVMEPVPLYKPAFTGKKGDCVIEVKDGDVEDDNDED